MTENELKISKLDDILALTAKTLQKTEENIKLLEENESDDFPELKFMALKFMKEQKQKYIDEIAILEKYRDHLKQLKED
jgi:hypothetical protein